MPMRLVQSFCEPTSQQLAQAINEWLKRNSAHAISIAFEQSKDFEYFHALLIYELL
jgi:hypothetical protein